MKKGNLELIIGPMYSGKSTELIKIANRYKCINKKILPVNHFLNSRYDTNNISTHDKNVFPDCLIVKNLFELKEKYLELFYEADIIIIEELQFYPDAYDFITSVCDQHHKTIIAAGLNGDSKRNPFGDVLRLIPHAEKVTFLYALCKLCGDGTTAHFTKDIKINDADNDTQIFIGGVEKYQSVCRYHYLSN